MSKIIDLAMRKAADVLRCESVGRADGDARALVFTFNREPTDAELRFLMDVMKRAAIMARAGRDER